jgi:hypothetical protein
VPVPANETNTLSASCPFLSKVVPYGNSTFSLVSYNKVTVSPALATCDAKATVV